MDTTGFAVAKMWHEILLGSSSEEDAAKYPDLAKHSPIEMNLLLMAGSNPNLLLRDYISMLHIPKSTLTSLINRLEKQQLIKRAISPADRRSYSLMLDVQGVKFLSSYTAYQNDIGARIVSGLNEAEREQLTSLLEKITTYMVRR